MSSRKSPQSRKRCPKGTRKCWATKTCVQKLKSNGKRCGTGSRKCANNKCYTYYRIRRRVPIPHPSPKRQTAKRPSPVRFSPRRTRSGKVRGGLGRMISHLGGGHGLPMHGTVEDAVRYHNGGGRTRDGYTGTPGLKRIGGKPNWASGEMPGNPVNAGLTDEIVENKIW